MDNNLIPAVCPNCGGKLEVDPSADTTTCQYCGTEHIIRRNVSGSVTLEAYARCPLCKRNDRSEKVSAIINSQTGRSEGIVQQQRISTNYSGQVYSQTVNAPTKTFQTSELARRLAPPPRPAAQSKSGPIITLVVAILFIFISGFGFLGTFVNKDVASITGVICWFLPALIAAGLLLLRGSMRRKTRQYQSSYPQWQQAFSRWEKLYYCGRDDIIFIPGEKTSATVGGLSAYIYTNPVK